MRGTVDTTEIGRINPDIRVESSVNPSSEAIPVTRANGILVALTVPQGALLRGTSALMRLDGWTWEESTLRCTGRHAPDMAPPEVPTDGREPRKTEEGIRKEKEDSLEDLRAAMAAARAYLKAKQAAQEGRAETPGVGFEVGGDDPGPAGEDSVDRGRGRYAADPRRRRLGGGGEGPDHHLGGPRRVARGGASREEARAPDPGPRAVAARARGRTVRHPVHRGGEAAPGRGAVSRSPTAGPATFETCRTRPLPRPPSACPARRR